MCENKLLSFALEDSIILLATCMTILIAVHQAAVAIQMYRWRRVRKTAETVDTFISNFKCSEIEDDKRRKFVEGTLNNSEIWVKKIDKFDSRPQNWGATFVYFLFFPLITGPLLLCVKLMENWGWVKFNLPLLYVQGAIISPIAYLAIISAVLMFTIAKAERRMKNFLVEAKTITMYLRVLNKYKKR